MKLHEIYTFSKQKGTFLKEKTIQCNMAEILHVIKLVF